MADVDITFGAKIDQLTAGVATVKTQLSGLSSGVGNLTSGFNQINNSISGVMGTFGRLGSVAALATSTLAAFGLDEFARSMAEKGVAMDRLKSSLGVTSEQLLTLKSAAELSGVEVESLAMTIQRMSLIIQRSSRDALGPQAQALRILGLSAKDFVGISADQYFLKIADAASKLKPSMERSIALQDIGGRSMIKMVGAFSKGAEEIKKFTEEMKVTKTGTEGFGEASETTHRNLILMDSATSSLSKQIFTQLSPALNTIIKQSTEFANGIRENIKAGGAWGLALDGVIFALKSIMTLLAGITAMFRFLGAEGKALWRAFSEEGEDAAKDIAKNLKAELEEMTNNLKNTLEEFWGKKPITVTPKPTDLLPAGEIDQLARKRLEMAMKTADGEIAS